MKAVKFILLTLFVVMLIGCSADSEPLSSDEESIPSGYKLIAVASYGEFGPIRTFYCEHLETGKVFICNNGTISDELSIPVGYKLITVASYGEFGPIRTFYCEHLETGKVFTCKVTVID